MPEMPGKINIIAMDINVHDPNYKHFRELTAEKKIDHMIASIEANIKTLQDQDPTSMQIFVWREYGISEAGSKFASIETKKLLKEKMQALTEKYPSLTIIAGTVATKKHFANFAYENLNEILEEYKTEHLQKIIQRENDPRTFLPASCKQLNLHHQQVTDLQQQYSVSDDNSFEPRTTSSSVDLSALPNLAVPAPAHLSVIAPPADLSPVSAPAHLPSSAPPPDLSKDENLSTFSNVNLTSSTLAPTQGVTVVRNRCFVAQKRPHADSIQCHDKTTPFLETEENYEDVQKNIVFRPGKSTTRSAVVMLTHPHTKITFPVGVEICAEHVHGVLQHELENEKDTPTPLLHFIVSDDVVLDLTKTAGIVIQVDSNFKPKVITKNGLDYNSIHFYQLNVLENTPSLRGPLQLLYPFENAVMDLIESTLLQINKNDKLSVDALTRMKNEFAESIKTPQIYGDLLDSLQQSINTCEKTIAKDNVTRLKEFLFSGPHVQSQQLVRKVLETLKILLVNERKNDARDIHSRKDAPLLQPQTASLTTSQQMKVKS